MKSKQYFMRSEYHERITRVMNRELWDHFYNEIDNLIEISVNQKLDWEKRQAVIAAMQGLVSSGKDDCGDIAELAIQIADVTIEGLNEQMKVTFKNNEK